jgi:hypothetical protein
MMRACGVKQRLSEWPRIAFQAIRLLLLGPSSTDPIGARVGAVVTSGRALLPDPAAASAPLDGQADRHPQADDHDAPAEDRG